MSDFPNSSDKKDYRSQEVKTNRPSDDVIMSRKEKVEKFVLKIEDNHTQEKKVDTVSNRPQTKGAVYFGNYQRRPGDTTAPKYVGSNTQKIPVGKDISAGQKKTDGDFDMFAETASTPSKTTSGANRNAGARSTGAKRSTGTRSTGARSTGTRNGTTAKKNTGKKKPASSNNKNVLTAAQRKKMGQIYSVTLCISLVLMLIGTIAFSVIGVKCVNDVLAISASDEEIEVTIPDNFTTSEAIDLFHEKGLIEVPWFCKIFAKFRGYEEEGVYYYDYATEKEKLKPYTGGTYYLSQSMGLEGMLNVLLDNRAMSEQTVSITFPEGYTTAQIVNRLEDYEIIKNPNKFISAANYDYQYDFIDSKNTGMAIKLEGYLFPDTYDMYIGESTSSVIKRFLENFNERWTDEYRKRAKELGLTTSEVLTIASIIQKEAAGPEQMADISSVIHNRLKKSSTYPLLQCDSTKNYVDIYLVNLLGENKAKAYLDKYDTAVCMGLPEGPICNPGIDAIHAALYPSDTSYLYFCHDKNGKVYYATTDYQHQQNVALISK